MITDNSHKAKVILSKALKFGVACGRIRPGKSGKQTQRYYWAKKGDERTTEHGDNRKTVKLGI